MSLPRDSEWLIERERAEDQVIRVTEVDGPRFEAEYVGINNTSKFTGEVRTRQSTALSLRQGQDTVPYYAFHVGVRQGDAEEYLGTWVDVANGETGKFRLSRRVADAT